MKPSRSIIRDIRGLRYHIRTWGDEAAPRLFMLHGFLDASASFQFLVNELRREWLILAPDWRGFGLTEWQRTSYYFPDYLADLDELLNAFSAAQPATLIGHSMGANVAGFYAGIRPVRVARLILLEGFGLPAVPPQAAPDRLSRWLGQIDDPPAFRRYPDFAALAARLRASNPRLSEERALFLAHHSGRQLPSGEVAFSGDPYHRVPNPILYRIEEAKACWRRITAPVLWVVGSDSELLARARSDPADYAARIACIARREDVVIKGAGHMLHHDQPEALAAVIERFVAR